MKKLFLAICFITLGLSNATAKVMEILDKTNVPTTQQMQKKSNNTIKNVTAEEMGEFLAQRAEDLVMIDEDKFNASNQQSVFVEPSNETRQDAEEAKKSGFQKIYEQAMSKATKGNEQPQRPDVAMMNQQNVATKSQQQKEWENPDFPVINILLPPNNNKVLAPATEHIPYLFANIEILYNGMVNFDETIMVVSNAEKLKKGLTKVFPKYLYSRNGDKQKIDYSLLSVSINDQPVDYKLIEQNNQIMFVPDIDYELGSGVYTYNFKYIINMAVWDYKDFREFYWDITGSAWDLVIARAGATVKLPPNAQPLGQEVFVGYPQQLNSDIAIVVRENLSTWGYAIPAPLFVGEGFHIVVSLPETAIMPHGLTNNLLQLIDDNGEIIFAMLGFVMILLSFIISWRYIKKNRGQLKFSLKKNAIMLRYLAFNKYDTTSFVAFLLELYRKNIIDIQQSEETILLIKRTDNLKTLGKFERKALNQLFTNNDAVLNLNSRNALKIKRAYSILSKDLYGKLRRFMFKANIGYLAFSWAMLLTTEFFIANLFNNTAEMWWTMFGITTLGGLTIFWFGFSPSRKWLNIINKILSIATMVLLFILMSAFISPWAVLFIAFSLLAIKSFTNTYSQRNGLLLSQIKEALDFQSHLMEQHDNILLGKGIMSQQANIVALDLINEFTVEENVGEFYKLNVAKEILKKFG